MAVPLRREVKRGTRGNDAFAVKRMLKRKGFGRGLALKGERRLRFGAMAVIQLKRFQRRYKVRADGVYGRTTHRKAVASGGFDRYGRWLMSTAPRPAAPVASKRSVIVATALLGARNRGAIHYTQGPRRMQGVRERIRPPRFPNYEDCSSFATWCYWVAGAPDPNGLGYNGYGYTGTQIRNGRRVSDPKPGDLIFYGSPVGHVAIYIGASKVVSHGSESGPLILNYRYRPINHIRSYL